MMRSKSRFTRLASSTLAFASAGLLHPHVPFDEAANLTLGIAASHNARDKLAVLLFGIAVLFRAKRDNRKKVFDLRNNPLLDDFSILVSSWLRRLRLSIWPVSGSLKS